MWAESRDAPVVLKPACGRSFSWFTHVHGDARIEIFIDKHMFLKGLDYKDRRVACECRALFIIVFIVGMSYSDAYLCRICSPHHAMEAVKPCK